MRQIAVIGSPNSGKSLLFNHLTGLHQKVANFPGATVSLKNGKYQHDHNIQITDFPGVYSLNTISGEEKIAVESFIHALKQKSLDAVICVVDSTRLEKGLVFALQIKQLCENHQVPLVIAANMQDVLQRNKLSMDLKGLSQALTLTVVPISAKLTQGIETLIEACKTASPSAAPTSELIGQDESAWQNRAEDLASAYGPKGEMLIHAQTRLDRFFLHSMLGGVSFFIIMYILFQSIFTWATPAMDAVEASLSWAASLLLPHLTGIPLLHSFVENALFGGIGAFLVFVPQIFVLTVIVGILEDSGYLARAAVICHKPLRFFGLTGKSFIPMLSGMACAIPGIYAARVIDSPRKRWLTYLAIPLIPCSARLPVYTLLIAAFIPASTAFGGLIGMQGLAMFAIYVFGIVCGLFVTAMVSRFQASSDNDLPFILEMPPYRIPTWRPLLRNAWDRSKHFVTKAGPIIFVVTILIWFLGYFPNHGADLSNSWLGYLGQLIEPLFAPFGLDWKYGIAILTSFLAREVFVGTLGTLYGIESADENIISLATRIQDSLLPLSAGIALLVFFALAMQCVSTLAILRREANSWKLPIQLFIGYSIFAYGTALIAFNFTELFL